MTGLLALAILVVLLALVVAAWWLGTVSAVAARPAQDGLHSGGRSSSLSPETFVSRLPGRVVVMDQGPDGVYRAK